MNNPNPAAQTEHDPGDGPDQQEVVEQGHIELLGRQFRIVSNGIDPREVAEYVRSAAGSSDAAFKQLEQFSAIQAIARTMEESVIQAKRLAENARAQAEAEAQQEKAQAVEEARQQAAETIERVTKTCRTSIDTVHSTLLEAIKDAFEKTREMTDRILAEMEENARAEVAAQLDQSSPATKPPEEESSEKEPGNSEAAAPEGNQAPPLPADDAPDLAGLYETWAKLQESESLLEATILGGAANPQGNGHDKAETDSAKDTEKPADAETTASPQAEVEQEPPAQPDEPPDAGEQAPSAIEAGPESEDKKKSDNEPTADEPSESGPRLYDGNVTLVLPQRVQASWMLDLRQRILDAPGAQILWESYADEEGAKLKLSLSEPLALSEMLRELPGVRDITDQNESASPKRKGLKWLSGNHQRSQVLAIQLGGSALR